MIVRTKPNKFLELFILEEAWNLFFLWNIHFNRRRQLNGYFTKLGSYCQINFIHGSWFSPPNLTIFPQMVKMWWYCDNLAISTLTQKIIVEAHTDFFIGNQTIIVWLLNLSSVNVCSVNLSLVFFLSLLSCP